MKNIASKLKDWKLAGILVGGLVLAGGFVNHYGLIKNKKHLYEDTIRKADGYLKMHNNFLKDYEMSTKISELTVEELKEIINESIHEAMEDFMEDLKAISSKDYINSIKEAREDYKAGNYKNFDETF